MRMRLGRPLIPMVFLLAALAGEPASADMLTGQIVGRFESFSGQIDAVDLEINGQTVNTGLITYQLDTAADPNNQWIIYDFDAMTQSYGVDLLVSAPLLTSLGEPAQKIRLLFSGAITSITPNDFTPGVFTSTVIEAGPLHGGGIFGPGQLFSGWEYSNIQITINTGDIKVENVGGVQVKDNSINVNGQNQGSLKSPGGTQQAPMTGTGTATVKAIPEPTSTVLILLGGLSVAGWSRIRKRSA